MGKKIIAQRRGKGSSTYRAPSHKYLGKVKYRTLDERERGDSLLAEVIDVLHDPGRTAPVARVRYENGEERLVLVAEGTSTGDIIECGISAQVKPGNVLPLGEVPEGVYVFNIESQPGDGGKFVRSSGCFAQIITHDIGKVVARLPSGVFKEFNPRCRATVGVVGGGGRREKPFLKAGKKYQAIKSKSIKWPRVRGVAMNAVDHPFGGGNKQHPGKPMTVSKDAPPGRKVGQIAARRTGKR